MAPDDARRLSTTLLLFAALMLLLAALWALRAPAHPNSDRYDYAGRAFHATQGQGLSPLVVYPLRMVFPGADRWPPENMTRPPLWPSLLIPGVKLGVGARSGVVLATIAAALLAMWLALVGDQSFGSGAGGMAALAFVTSFATVAGLRGAGPELAMGLLTILLWTWFPRGGGRWAYLACGSLYGLLPLLHPAGWVFALAALLARPRRYGRRELPWIVLGWIAVAAPWHLRLVMLTGQPLGMLQSYAELAKSLTDPGGLGPYRGLTAMPTSEVVSAHAGEVIREALHRLKEMALHLDGWLAWPWVVLALVGARQEPRLAVRDAILGVGCFVVLVGLGADFRLLLPLLPVACVWVGAGLARLADPRPRWPWAPVLVLIAALPWLLPMGSSVPPTALAREIPLEQAHPPALVIDRLRSEGNTLAPIVTESAVISWEARRNALFLPDTPTTLEFLRSRAPLRGVELLALGAGRVSQWTAGHQASWDSLFARCEVLFEHRDGAVVLRLPPAGADDAERDEPTTAVESRHDRADAGEHGGDVDGADPTGGIEPAALPSMVRVDREHRLSPGFVPGDLIELPSPPALREGLRMRAEAWAAFQEMAASAAEDGLRFWIVSAYRSYDRQVTLHDRAVERHGADQGWVAPPGASEHQLGTTVDVADGERRHVLEQSFGETAEGTWLARHCGDFGFVITYDDSTAAAQGYQPEPWHLRFVGDGGRRP